MFNFGGNNVVHWYVTLGWNFLFFLSFSLSLFEFLLGTLFFFSRTHWRNRMKEKKTNEHEKFVNSS